MCENQYIVCMWLQLGIEKYSLNLDFTVYAVSVTSFIECGVRVLAGLPVASEKRFISFICLKNTFAS